MAMKDCAEQFNGLPEYMDYGLLQVGLYSSDFDKETIELENQTGTESDYWQGGKDGMKFEVKNGVGIIPKGTTSIEKKAFNGCTGLTSITIPDIAPDCLYVNSVKSMI